MYFVVLSILLHTIFQSMQCKYFIFSTVHKCSVSNNICECKMPLQMLHNGQLTIEDLTRTTEKFNLFEKEEVKNAHDVNPPTGNSEKFKKHEQEINFVTPLNKKFNSSWFETIKNFTRRQTFLSTVASKK